MTTAQSLPVTPSAAVQPTAVQPTGAIFSGHIPYEIVPGHTRQAQDYIMS